MYASTGRASFFAVLLITTSVIAQDASDPSRKIDGSSLTSPQEQQEAIESMQSESGMAGRDEPSAHAIFPPGDPVFKDGVLDVPGGSREGPTAPSKFSERNAVLDKLPTTVLLSDKQRTAVARSVGGALVHQVNPKFAEEIPSNIALNDLPQEVADLPALRGLKYIRLPDRVILVDSASRRVVAAVAYPSNRMAE